MIWVMQKYIFFKRKGTVEVFMGLNGFNMSWNCVFKYINNQKLEMSQSMIARKMNLEKAQIRSILNDYRKAKQKCISLSEQINEEFSNKNHFDSVEKQTSLKMELLGLNELVEMKNTLVNTLSQLFDLQNDLNTKKERLEARRSFKNISNSPIGKEPSSPVFKKNLSMFENFNQKHQPFEEQIKIKPKTHNFNVPVYRVKDDTNQNKVDRLSKYVASLKRNMKQHCSETGGKKIKDMLFEEPEFLKVKEELERYKMREEELLCIMDRKIQKGIEEAIKKASLLEETREYKILKFNKVNKNAEKTADQSSHSSQYEKSYLKEESKESKSKIKQHPIEEYVKEDTGQKEKVVVEVKKETSKQESHIEEVMSKISSSMGTSEAKLKELREQRKKIFFDDDVWDEFEQI